jgi:hypothetical protein
MEADLPSTRFGMISIYPRWFEQSQLIAETVPDNLTSALRITHFPTSPDLPPPLRATSAMLIMACYNGEAAEGEALLSPMRSLGTALLDTFALIPYSQVATISNDPDDAAPLFLYNESSAFQALASKDIETLLDIAGNRASGIFQIEIRQLGGALARQPEDAMAFNREPDTFRATLSCLLLQTSLLQKRPKWMQSYLSLKDELRNKGCAISCE